jgi:hypothetical protein
MVKVRGLGQPGLHHTVQVRFSLYWLAAPHNHRTVKTQAKPINSDLTVTIAFWLSYASLFIMIHHQATFPKQQISFCNSKLKVKRAITKTLQMKRSPSLTQSNKAKLDQ